MVKAEGGKSLQVSMRAAGSILSLIQLEHFVRMKGWITISDVFQKLELYAGIEQSTVKQ